MWSVWLRGMIHASHAKGPGFDPHLCRMDFRHHSQLIGPGVSIIITDWVWNRDRNLPYSIRVAES